MTRLWDGWSGVRIPAWTRDFYLLQNVQKGSGNHPASFSIWAGILSRRKSGWGVKETSRLHSVLRTIGATPLPPLYALVGCTGYFHHLHLILNTYFRLQQFTRTFLSVNVGSEVTDCAVSMFTADSTVADSNCCSSATVSPDHRWPKRVHSHLKAGKRSEFWWKLQIQVDLKFWLRNDKL